MLELARATWLKCTEIEAPSRRRAVWQKPEILSHNVVCFFLTYFPSFRPPVSFWKGFLRMLWDMWESRGPVHHKTTSSTGLNYVWFMFKCTRSRFFRYIRISAQFLATSNNSMVEILYLNEIVCTPPPSWFKWVMIHNCLRLHC